MGYPFPLCTYRRFVHFRHQASNINTQHSFLDAFYIWFKEPFRCSHLIFSSDYHPYSNPLGWSYENSNYFHKLVPFYVNVISYFFSSWWLFSMFFNLFFLFVRIISHSFPLKDWKIINKNTVKLLLSLWDFNLWKGQLRLFFVVVYKLYYFFYIKQ